MYLYALEYPIIFFTYDCQFSTVILFLDCFYFVHFKNVPKFPYNRYHLTYGVFVYE